MALFSLRRHKRKSSHISRADLPHLNADIPFIVKEAYSAIRTKLMFTGKGEKCPVFAVTSAFSADGKTTNAVSLAVSIAMAEKRVLLIDGDMRKPSVHRHFALECRNGLSEILAGLTSDVKLRKTEHQNLSVLTAGEVPPNPAELLGAKQMDTLLEYVRQFFDYVIIDTPPVNIVTDASVIAGKVTGYVIVVQSGKNHLRDVHDAVRQLESMNGNIVGLILNDPENKAEAHGSYYYKRYYNHEQGKYYGDVPEKHK